MKKIIIILLLINSFNLIAQSENDWSNWTTLYSDARGSLSISFKIRKCVANSRYRIQSTFNEHVRGKVYFDFPNCDGKITTESSATNFDGPKIDDSSGNWFLVYKDGGVNNIRITDLKFPDREKIFADQKLTVVDGHIISKDQTNPQGKTKELNFGKFRGIIKKDTIKRIKWNHEQDANGVRADNTKPKIEVESMAIQSGTTINKKSTTKKK